MEINRRWLMNEIDFILADLSCQIKKTLSSINMIPADWVVMKK
jgi:hypothetical protein